MPPSRTEKGKANDATTSKHNKPAKKVKPEVPLQEKLQKRWRSIKDQIQDGYLEHALKSVKKVLELDPANQLGNQTYLQLLLSLDRYAEALKHITADEQLSTECKIERCYALYKLSRMEEAAQILEDIRKEAMAVDDEDTERTLDVLDAQIKYRLERLEDSQLMYEDLLASVDTDSPEYADLSTNLSACSSHLEFIASIPSLLGDLTSANKLPSIDTLENNPVAPLVSAHPAYKARAQPTASTSTTPAVKRPKKQAPKKVKETKLPPSVAALPEDERPAPDPERWLPKRERKGYAEVVVAKEKEKEKKRLKAKKKLEATLTQGAAAEEAGQKPQQSQPGGAGNKGNQQQKKKKGKK